MLHHFVMWNQIEWITDITHYDWGGENHYSFYIQTKSGRKLEYEGTDELEIRRVRREIIEKAQGWLYLASRSHGDNLL